MICMENALILWLVNELEDRGWSQRELARRASVSQTTVSEVLSGQRRPTWDFCAAVARAFHVSEDRLFVLGGLKPPPPPAVAEEREAVTILRELPPAVRAMALTILRALAGKPGYMQVAEVRQVYAADPQSQLDEEFWRVWREMTAQEQEFVLDQARRLHTLRVHIIGGEEAGARRSGTVRPRLSCAC